MTLTPGTADAKPRRTQIRWGIIAIGLVLLILAMLALLVLIPPSGLITGQIQNAVREATGRDLKVGSGSYTIRDTVSIELNDVSLANAAGIAGPEVFKAKSLRTSLPLRSIWNKKYEITNIELDAPEFSLTRDAKGFNNWTIGGTSVGSPVLLPVTKITKGTLTYADGATGSSIKLDEINANLASDPKWGGTAAKGTARFKNEPLGFDLNVADTKAAIDGKNTVIGLIIDSKHLKAKLNGDGALGELPLLAGEIEATSPSARDLAAWLGFSDMVPADLGKVSIKSKTDPKTGRTSGVGEAVFKGEAVDYDLAVADLKGAWAGKPAAIDGTVSTNSLKAKLAGTANLGTNKSFSGDIEASSPALGGVAKWFGVTHDGIAKLGAGAIKGHTTVAGRIIDLDKASFDIDGRKGNFTGRLDASAIRPRITGTLDTPRINLAALAGGAPSPAPAFEATPEDPGFASTWDALLAELKELEDGPGARLDAQPLAAAAKPAWSTDPINLNVLKSVDLDLIINAAELAFGDLDLKKGRIKAALNNGTLSAKIEELGIGGGKAIGSVDVDGQARPPKAKVTLRLTDVPAEPIIKVLTGRPLLTGNSNIDITTSATGQTLNQIISTLEGNARIDMGKGALRGWDIGLMVNQFWNYGGWGFNAAKTTNFDKLLANYDIKTGIVRSAPDLSMTGSETNVSSRGDVNMPTKQIKQELRITNFPIPILIKGDWTKKLWIGPSFLSSSSSKLASKLSAEPQAALSKPDIVPPEVQAAVARILAQTTAADRLSSESKALLQSLLPSAARPDPAVDTAPQPAAQ